MNAVFILLLLLMLLCVFYFKHHIIAFYNKVRHSIYENENNSNSENEKFKNVNQSNNSGDSDNSKSVLKMNKNNDGGNDGLKYYQNDTLNQSGINENSYDVINQIDKVDYGDVKTGMQKCQESCKGICLEYGYTGSATCYPKPKQTFDYGTLYKNPTFSYGTNAYKPKTDNTN